MLGGRVQYRQFVTGYRTGIEPVLLAAAIPARPGDRVVEAGTGAGAALLCLAARIPRLTGTGLEIDPDLAALARLNFAANAHPSFTIEETDVADWRPDQPYDHAFANPPWHDATGTRSPDPGRDRAKAAPPSLLATWINTLARAVKPRGTLTLIHPAAHASHAIAAMVAADYAELTLLPLWPRLGCSAKLIILQARRSGHGSCEIRPGLSLHTAEGAYTPDADAVLKQGNAL